MLSELTTSDFSTIIELYYKINPGADILYLFLDEIQEIDGWELLVRRLTEKKLPEYFLPAHPQNCYPKK